MTVPHAVSTMFAAGVQPLSILLKFNLILLLALINGSSSLEIGGHVYNVQSPTSVEHGVAEDLSKSINRTPRFVITRSVEPNGRITTRFDITPLTFIFIERVLFPAIIRVVLMLINLDLSPILNPM